jgi:CRISPR-associated Cas5-like protein
MQALWDGQNTVVDGSLTRQRIGDSDSYVARARTTFTIQGEPLVVPEPPPAALLGMALAALALGRSTPRRRGRLAPR